MLFSEIYKWAVGVLTCDGLSALAWLWFPAQAQESRAVDFEASLWIWFSVAWALFENVLLYTDALPQLC